MRIRDLSDLCEKPSIMKQKSNPEYYDVTAHLIERFGPVGSETWKAEESRAWEEYNAEILREARRQAGITQAELAERIGSDKSYISKIEHGKTVPTVASFYRIVSALGMQVHLTKNGIGF